MINDKQRAAFSSCITNASRTMAPPNVPTHIGHLARDSYIVNTLSMNMPRQDLVLLAEDEGLKLVTKKRRLDD